MGDPYAPKGWPRGASEVRTPLESFSQRLAQLGASPDEVAQVVAGWDDLDPDGTPDGWTLARRNQVLAMQDAELHQLLVEGREEYDFATTTEAEADQREADRRLAQAQAEAEQVIHGSVGTVLEWVGTDRARAQAVLALETTRPGPRKTLLEPLKEMTE